MCCCILRIGKLGQKNCCFYQAQETLPNRFGFLSEFLIRSEMLVSLSSAGIGGR